MRKKRIGVSGFESITCRWPMSRETIRATLSRQTSSPGFSQPADKRASHLTFRMTCSVKDSGPFWGSKSCKPLAAKLELFANRTTRTKCRSGSGGSIDAAGEPAAIMASAISRFRRQRPRLSRTITASTTFKCRTVASNIAWCDWRSSRFPTALQSKASRGPQQWRHASPWIPHRDQRHGSGIAPTVVHIGERRFSGV